MEGGGGGGCRWRRWRRRGRVRGGEVSEVVELSVGSFTRVVDEVSEAGGGASTFVVVVSRCVNNLLGLSLSNPLRRKTKIS